MCNLGMSFRLGRSIESQLEKLRADIELTKQLIDKG